jgi:hypothetical protein
MYPIPVDVFYANPQITSRVIAPTMFQSNITLILLEIPIKIIRIIVAEILEAVETIEHSIIEINTIEVEVDNLIIEGEGVIFVEMEEIIIIILTLTHSNSNSTNSNSFHRNFNNMLIKQWLQIIIVYKLIMTGILISMICNLCQGNHFTTSCLLLQNSNNNLSNV